eukprot:TRINITY_DN8327_c0_g1_i1.p1 TRINITY_DN8327_c0_g1~~TRINITY_DN8327_c0_g1_i1.p1  ORF type:complete len:370 (-),score=42.90 TRINITY_DN8327_c0_g1_i1:70-1179(-)
MKEENMNFTLLQPKNMWKRKDVWPFLVSYPPLIICAVCAPIPSWICQAVPVLTLILETVAMLLSSWSVALNASIRYDPAPSLARATHVLVEKVFKKQNRKRLLLCPLFRDRCYYLDYYKKKYEYDDEAQTFIKIRRDYSQSFRWYSSTMGMTTEEELKNTLIKYGNNSMVIPMPTFQELLQEHVVAPFFVFQMFCNLLWMLEEYWYFSLMSFAMLFIFESTVVFARLNNMKRIRGMRIKHRNVDVYRNKRWTTISSEQLVPGDIIALKPSANEDDNRMPCDMLLLAGTCTVNESILTGESVPQVKEAIITRDNMDEKFALKTGEHKMHILYGRTELLHCARDLTRPHVCLLYTSPSPRDLSTSRMPSSA